MSTGSKLNIRILYKNIYHVIIKINFYFCHFHCIFTNRKGNSLSIKLVARFTLLELNTAGTETNYNELNIFPSLKFHFLSITFNLP